MPTFTYRARDSVGRVVEGVTKAPSAGEARYAVSSQGLALLQLDAKSAWWNVELSPKRIKPKQLMLVSRQLATFIRAGIPILDSLSEICESPDRSVRRVFGEIKDDLQSGLGLADAFARHPQDFPAFYLAILRSAELTGELDVVLDQLGDYIERNIEAKRQVKSAMFYPSLVAVMAVGTSAVLTGFVLPKFKEFFEGSASELPATTAFLLSLSDFVVAWWWIGAVVVAVGVVGYVLALRTDRGRLWRDRLLLRIPVIGPTIRCSLVERFTRLLGAMVDAGVPLPEAMPTATASLNNLAFSGPLTIAWRGMMGGAGLAQPIAGTHLFPAVANQMIKVGESTGTLDKQLRVAAEYYAQEMSERVKRMSAMVEPAVIVFVGLVVGFVAVALVSAMYGIYSTQDLQ